jgi:putative SOS response-associated peptidase YedK
MCGRYCIAADPGELTEHYQTDIPCEYRPGYNISPQRLILIITGQNMLVSRMATWGFHIPSFPPVINARIETLNEKPLFKNLLHNYRCLIPATGYFEWKQEGKRKVPYYISPKNDGIFSVAGLYRQSSQYPEVVIITTDAVYSLQTIHTRMPVIVPKELESNYLAGKEIDSLSEDYLHAFSVSSRVNSVKYDDKTLIIPEHIHPAQSKIDGNFS